MSVSTFNIGVVIDAAMSKSYFNTFNGAGDKVKELGVAMNKSNARLNAVNDMEFPTHVGMNWSHDGDYFKFDRLMVSYFLCLISYFIPLYYLG